MAFGCIFAPGLSLEVPERFAKKFEGNRFFELVEDRGQTTADEDPIAVDGDYDPYQGMEKSALVQLASERNIEIDGRWGAKRIIEELKAGGRTDG